MGFGGTAKKLQTVVDAAEELYTKVNALREQVGELRERVEATSEKVDRLEHTVEEQRVLVEAIARDQGIDVDVVLADAAIEEAAPRESDDPDGSDGSGGSDDTDPTGAADG